MERSLESFNIIESKNPIPTIEIDTATIENSNYYEILEECLIKFAEDHPDVSISIYEHSESVTCNFGMPTGALYLIIANSKVLFDKIYASLASVKDLRFMQS